MILPKKVWEYFTFAASLGVFTLVIFKPGHLSRTDSSLDNGRILEMFDSGMPKSVDELADDNQMLSERIFPEYRNPIPPDEDLVTFKQVVEAYSDSEKQIFISTVDSSEVEMAFNLYLTSYLSLDIDNYLFIGTDSDACELLNNYESVHCFSNEFSKETEELASDNHGGAGFISKTHYKTQLILEALRFECTVIIVDLDIVFLKNPLKHLTCESCDIQIKKDVHSGNTGFYLARPSQASITLHEKVLELGRNKTDLIYQKILDRTIKSMVKQKRLKMKALSLDQFPCGSKYFEEKNIMFLGDANCSECVLVHNNWIVSQEAQIYRFKENGMWQVDSNGYYSDPNRKYVTYDNPVDFGADRTKDLETEALKIALYLGHLLNRTLILPTFHCYGCKNGACRNFRKRCALNTFCRISTFDKYFKDSYREHVFLNHSSVPDSVKKNLSPVVLIKYEAAVAALNVANLPNVKTFIPKDLVTGATDSELIAWFHEAYDEYSVLRFHSLYGSVTLSGNPGFVETILDSLESADYRQN